MSVKGERRNRLFGVECESGIIRNDCFGLGLRRVGLVICFKNGVVLKESKMGWWKGRGGGEKERKAGQKDKGRGFGGSMDRERQ